MIPAFNDSYLDALQRHDPVIEEHFVSCFSKALKAPLRRRLHRTQAIEDVTQETMLRVLSYFRTGKTLRAASNLPAFVSSVSHNVSRELFRAEARSEPLNDDYDRASEVSENPESTAISHEEAAKVRRTLATLPPKDRRILESVFLKESDRDQLCRDLHTSRDHLRVLLLRARQRFRAAAEREKKVARPCVSGLPFGPVLPAVHASNSTYKT